MHRLLLLLLPERLGRDFRWLWGGFGVSNLADGILLAAGPLLVTSLTRDPFLISLAVFAQRVPWLLFGIPAGAIIDRVDRRRLIIGVDLARSVVVATLAVTVATGTLTLPVLYAVLFLIGTAETFGDNAASAMVATTVPSEHLGLANARIVGVNLTTNQLAGPPIGALLFAAGLAVPFGVNAVLLLLGAVLLTRIATTSEVREPRTAGFRTEVREGLSWLRHDRPVRRLAVLITVFNVTFGAVWGILVVYALERLGLDELGFGLLLTASAVGGVVGSAFYERLERRLSYATLLRVGLMVETFTHLGLALTSSWVVAGAVLVAFGVHAAVWGSLSHTIRLRAVPERLLGRVTSVYQIGSVGGLAVGTPLGGLLAEQYGILAPFWFAFVGSALATVWAWRSIDDVSAAGEVDAAATESVTT